MNKKSKQSMNIAKVLRTIFFYLVFICAVLLLVPPMLLLALLPARWRYNRCLYFLLYLFYWIIVKAMLLPVSIQGKNNLPTEPVIFVANHQSVLDIPFIGQLLGSYPHLWLYKYELDAVPILGFFARRFGVSVARSSLRDGARALMDSLKLVQGQARHLMIFPEGGRFIDGKVHDFFAGFAMIASKTARPVVPIYLKNVYKVCPPGHFSIGYAPVSVIVGPSFVMAAHETAQDFTKRVHDWFLKMTMEQE